MTKKNIQVVESTYYHRLLWQNNRNARFCNHILYKLYNIIWNTEFNFCLALSKFNIAEDFRF